MCLTFVGTLMLSMPAVTNIAVGDQPAAAKQESLDGIIASCQAAKSQFHPLTKEDLKSVKTELTEALAKLDAKLQSAGENGRQWREFLLWDTLQKELQKDEFPNLDNLNKVYDRYNSGNEGLRLVWFVDVQSALSRLSALTNAVNIPQMKDYYERTMDKLAGQLQAYAAKPSTENAVAISDSLTWLKNARQAPEIITAVERNFGYPNLYGEASAEFVQAAVGEPIDENTPICDNILGTSLSGTGHTVGQTTAELIPDANMGIIDTMLFATTYSTTVGSHGPVCIYTNGTTCIGACKRLWINQYGFCSYPAVSNAVTQTCINDIQAQRKIVERIAWKRAGQQKAEAECIASQHAQLRVNKRVDDQAAETLDKAQQNFTNKFRNPLVDHKLFPEQLQFSTDPQALRVVSMEVGNSLLAAPTPPPSAISADMVLRVHESLINNFALDALGGMTVNEDNFQKSIVDMFGKLPEKMKRDENLPPWIITFARQQPISVTFSDGGFKILIRGTQFINGDNSCGDMDITVVYDKFEKTETGFKAIRQGDIQYVFYDEKHKPKKENLTPREVAIKRLMSQRFSKIFEPELVGKGLTFTGKLEKVGKMQPVEIQSHDGWLTIAWKRTQAEVKDVKAE
jgi:hypothetical protein